MSRAVWFVAGTGAGVYAAVRARRAAEILTVDGLRDRVGAAITGARIFRAEVAQGKADAESGLRERMGVRLHEHHEVTARRTAALDAAPTDHRDHDPTRPPGHTDTSTNEPEEGTS